MLRLRERSRCDRLVVGRGGVRNRRRHVGRPGMGRAAAQAPMMARSWSGRLPLLVLLLAVLSGAGLFAAAGTQGTLAYYRTPTELMAAPGDQTVRLGGLVVEGSVTRAGGKVRFAISDDRNQVDVVVDAVPPATFRPGQGAVVTGTLGSDGVFHGHSVVVRHDNQYEPSEALAH